MNISSKNQEILLNEFEIVFSKLDEVEDFGEKLYFASALHGMVQRIMNIEFDKTLLVLHHVLQHVHGAFNARVNAMAKNADKPLQITDEMMTKYVSLLEELVNHIKNDEDVNSVLNELIVLAYSTTGNGYYLLQKGMLTI